MQINVAQLLKAEVGAFKQHPVDGEIVIDGAVYAVKGELVLINTGRKILVQGTLSAAAGFTCSRCLQPYTAQMPLKIEEEYYPVIDVNTGTKLEAPEDNGAFKIDERHTLDLSEAIRQYIVMALPMKPLCREDCAGICPTCGKDLNLGKCDCPAEAVDPRWAELLKLKKNTRVTNMGKRGEKGRK